MSPFIPSSVAFLQAVARPKFRGPRSASIARSQVWLGLPTGRFVTQLITNNLLINVKKTAVDTQLND